MAGRARTVIKRVFKWLGLLVLVVLLLGGSFAAHEWNADKPFYLNNFLNRTLAQVAMSRPELLTSMGFLESVGIDDHNSKLNDASPAATDRLLEQAEKVRATLERYDDEELDENEVLSKEIVLYLMGFLEEGKKFRYHNYPVNQFFGVQNGFPSFMDSMHRINDEEDAEHYLARLTAVKVKFDQVLEGLRIREDAKILPPRFVVDRVLVEMQNFVKTPATENILYTSFKQKLEKAENLPADTKAPLLADAEKRIQQSVYPAYQGLIDYFEGIRDKTATDDGVWRLPDGDTLYALALRLFTTTNFTPQEVHAVGLREVDRIQTDILSILETEGYDTSGGFFATMEAFTADERFYYPDTDEGRRQILEDYRKILHEIDAGLDDAFRIRPKAKLEVARMPEFKEATAPGAYYERPALDRSRPGRFFTNLRDIKATPKFGMRTLAYHEGIPGHHFQIAISQELEGLPFVRRMSPFTAFTEGWALYTEQLAWELGFQKDPSDNVGRLQAELFRGVRLVVDTGIHAMRWTREQGIEYMLTNTGMAKSDVVAEVERYIVMPGQATAYKVGMMKILELRERARSKLGDKFDLRDFHDVVLKNGAVPLDILERLVDQYIEEASREGSPDQQTAAGG